MTLEAMEKEYQAAKAAFDAASMALAKADGRRCSDDVWRRLSAERDTALAVRRAAFDRWMTEAAKV